MAGADIAEMLRRVDHDEDLRARNRWVRLVGTGTRIPRWRAASAWHKVTGRPVHLTREIVTGSTMNLVAPELASAVIFQGGVFEPQLTRSVLRLLRAGQTFYDVGAHFGYFSLVAAAVVGRAGHVHAFEPTPSTRQLLRLNTEAHPHVTVVDRPAWSISDEELVFHDLGVQYSAFNSAFEPRLTGSAQGVRREHVLRSVSLDKYAEEHGAPDFVKVDAESAESHVIAGMARLLAEARPIVSIEVGDLDLPGVPNSSQTLARVVDHGYDVVRMTRAGLVTDTLHDRYEYDNVLLVPREKTAGLLDSCGQDPGPVT